MKPCLEDVGPYDRLDPTQAGVENTDGEGDTNGHIDVHSCHLHRDNMYYLKD